MGSAVSYVFILIRLAEVMLKLKPKLNKKKLNLFIAYTQYYVYNF